jgi:hypothetical protein
MGLVGNDADFDGEYIFHVSKWYLVVSNLW